MCFLFGKRICVRFLRPPEHLPGGPLPCLRLFHGYFRRYSGRCFRWPVEGRRPEGGVWYSARPTAQGRAVFPGLGVCSHTRAETGRPGPGPGLGWARPGVAGGRPKGGVFPVPGRVPACSRFCSRTGNREHPF